MAKLDMHKELKINPDAFSSGQVGSKIWLCEKIESLSFSDNVTIWIYGGWYGITGLLLLTRNLVPINKVRSFDIDPSCQTIADSINENWVWRDWKFKAFTADCNSLDPASDMYGPAPDLIINTSVEHMGDKAWFNRLPAGIMVALQSNDMNHNDHESRHVSMYNFSEEFPLAKTHYLGKLDFNYPSWQFSRYMKIGIV